MAYNQIDEVLHQLQVAMQYAQSVKRTDLYSTLFTAYRSLNQKRNIPGVPLRDALQKAKVLLNDKKTNYPQSITQGVANIGGMTGWESSGGYKPFSVEGRIEQQPPTAQGQPGTIVIRGLNFYSNPQNEWVKAQMGTAMQSVGQDSVIRATREAWQHFIQLSSAWCSDPSVLANFAFNPQLPSEKKFAGPTYQLPKQKRNLEVTIVNTGGERDPTVPPKGTELDYSRKGIKLTFPQNDQYFFIEVDNAKGFGIEPKILPSQYAMVIYDAKAENLIRFSKKLQDDGYQNIGKFNEAITTLTGKAYGETLKQFGDKQKSAVKLSPAVVQNAIKANIDPNPPDRGEFDQHVRGKYPNAFKGGDSWSKAVADGVYFSTTREASVLADEPGSGKTSQAMIAADMMAEKMGGKKVLVITPGILIKENWTSPTQGPIFFCQHTPDMIAVISSFQNLNQALSNPKVRWVVVANSTLGQSAEGMAIATGISKASKQGVFATAIMDEFQMIKDIDSDVATSVRQAVSSSGIPHRIGLTGTPADNDPSNLYQQLRMIRHPLVYRNTGKKADGTTDLIIRQNGQGFANQFLGGEAFLNDKASGGDKARSVMKWASSLDDKQMLSLMDLFSTTYIRRNKKDIRDDIPEKTEQATPVSNAGDAQKWEQRENELAEQARQNGKTSNAKQQVLSEMAAQKVPSTIQKALQHIQGGQKIFIVTKHPELAKQIQDGINAQVPDSCVMVHGGTGDAERERVAQEFKDPNSKARAAVYTMGTGAVGLNFKVANKALFNDMDWNPSTNLQAEYRVHRINSEHPVEVEYQYIPGTYDEQQYLRVVKKRKINDATNNILRAASSGDRVKLAHEFTINLVASLLSELDLVDQTQQQVDAFQEQLKAKLQKTELTHASWYKREMKFA